MARATDRPIFLLACCWRSGSTLLQRYVNSTGQAFVWGEHLGLVRRLSAAFAPLQQREPLSQRDAASLVANGQAAWIANLTPPFEMASSAAIREALKGYYEAATRERGFERWGFKEVRYDASQARLLLHLFPEARIVFLVRRLENVLASMAVTFWYDTAGGAEGVVDHWCGVTRSFADFSDPRVVTLRYEDLVQAPAEATRALAVHLDLPETSFDRRVLATRVRGGLPMPSPNPPGNAAALLSGNEAVALSRHFYPES